MLSHDEIVARAVEARRHADGGAILRAFVGSLSTRNLPARSAFGSYAVLQAFAAHAFQGSERFSGGNCAVCGLQQSMGPATEGWVANYPFQVQHTDVRYAMLDLETFSRRDVDEPTPDSVDRLGRLLANLRALPAESQLSQLRDSIAGAIKSNKHERQILLETFGYAGILCPESKHHYGQGFVTWERANSDQPEHFYKREWAYPVRFWSGRDGVNELRVQSTFGAFQ